MKCLSLDHKKADVAIRRRVAFSSVQRAEIMKSLPQGAIVLVTCNRTELYYRGNREDGEVALQAFARRGIGSAVGLQHVPGDLIKFYGVEGTGFFYYYYPTAGGHFSKFGLERANGAPGGYAFDVAALKRTADRAARLSGLTVYGGDCIVRPAGDFCLIDFNDWPSFSLCKDEAAAAIAQKLFNTGRQTAGSER